MVSLIDLLFHYREVIEIQESTKEALNKTSEFTVKVLTDPEPSDIDRGLALAGRWLALAEKSVVLGSELL